MMTPGDPLIVAELSCNHAGRLDLAKSLIRAAKRAGADAIKLQVFEPEQMAPKDGPSLTDGPWAGRRLHDLYRRAMTPIDWLAPLADMAREMGMEPFASVFAPETVAIVEREMRPALWKVASAEAGWGTLVDACLATGKPVLVSDGAVAVDPAPGIIVMRCVAEYPADIGTYGFRDLATSSALWGLSDHSMDITTWTTAAALGASVIEAHIMLQTYPIGMRTLDEGHSLRPDTFRAYATAARHAARMAYTPRQMPRALEFQRRAVWAHDINELRTIRQDDIMMLRGPLGMLYAADVVGRTLTRTVQRHEPVMVEHLR